MKKRLIAVGAALLLSLSTTAAAASPTLVINGITSGADAMATVWNDTTYVSLRSVSSSLDNRASIHWENGIASVQTDSFLLTARPGETYITVNNTTLPVPYGVKSAYGRTLIPVRVLAQVFDASVYWNPTNNQISLVNKRSSESSTYTEEDMYWLSRIISAESRGEPLEGKIAVGNVVLNRVAHQDFPNTIYEVIFDNRWGGQFEPVRNGTIYNIPTEESVQAAQMCLNGTNVIGDSLYFLAPALAQNFWVPQNREYIATIGCHDFYR